MTMSAQHFDVVVVGAGPAGLSAALVLGRVRRRVLLLDTESPANSVSSAMHGFLSQDGTPPAEVRRVAREQLRAYETVEYCRLAACAARRLPAGGFEVDLEGWEVRDRAIAVYCGGHRAVHQALLLVSLSDDVVLLTDGGPDLRPSSGGAALTDVGSVETDAGGLTSVRGLYSRRRRLDSAVGGPQKKRGGLRTIATFGGERG
jgi:thioredoxin reductase